MRSLSEILKEADRNKDCHKTISKLWVEVKVTTLQRDPVEVSFAREYLLPILRAAVIKFMKDNNVTVRSL